jgi:2-phosphosulfolactate phosphatase
MFSLEDAVCAGMVIHQLIEGQPSDWILTDAALASQTLYRSFSKGLLKMIRNTDHGRYLQEIGFGEDLKACAGVDVLPVVPLLDGNVIRLRRDAEKKEPVQQSVSS